MAYPNRYVDLLHEYFGRDESQLSRIFNTTLELVYARWHHFLENLDQPWIQPRLFSQAIERKGSPLPNCWGFIDGTLRPYASRATYKKRYTSHKRQHGLKFQAVTTPDSMLAHLFGPIPGNRHDAAMLRQSSLLTQLEQCPKFATYYMYGDAAYGMHPHLIYPYRNARNSPDKDRFNNRMSKLRQAVEWGFSKVSCYFAFVDFKKTNWNYIYSRLAKYIQWHLCWQTVTRVFMGVKHLHTTHPATVLNIGMIPPLRIACEPRKATLTRDIMRNHELSKSTQDICDRPLQKSTWVGLDFVP